MLVAGLDSFKAKKEKRKERKRRAKLRKAEQREREKSSGVVLTAATRAKSTPVLPEVIEYKDPKKRKRKQETEVSFAFHSLASVSFRYVKLNELLSGAGTGAKGNTGEKDEEIFLVARDDDEVGAIRRVQVRDARNGQSVEGGRRGGQARLARGQEAQEQGIRIQRAQGI